MSLKTEAGIFNWKEFTIRVKLYYEDGILFVCGLCNDV